MRQAIKGDGSDGTDDLKAYLLAHDAVLAQELYEFTRPGIGGGAGIGTVPTQFDMLTTRGTFQPYSPLYFQLSGYILGPHSGKMWRWESATLGGYGLPGNFVWDYSPAGAYAAPGFDTASIPRSQIARVYASITQYTVPGVSVVWDPFKYFGISFDGGATWNEAILPASPTALESVYDITSYIPGGVAAYDFTQLQLRLRNDSSLLIFDTPPGWQCFVPKVTVRFTYASPAAGGIVAPVSLGGFTDASSPLTYAGNVYKPAHIKNNGFKSKIGLDVDSLQLEWKFRGDEAMVTDPVTGATILTMLQGFQQGLWDGVWVKWRRPYMPKFGDCDSLGAVSMFRGRIAEVEVNRLTAKITVNSVTEMFNRQVPQQLIESNNRSLQIGPGLPPDLDPDPTHWTVFQCAAGQGGTVQKIVAQQTAPTGGQVYAPGTYDLGYLLFSASPLQNIVAQVERYEVIAGYNVFYLFKPLYVDPHGYPLSFTAFVPVPRDQTISGAGNVDLPGFPRVPLPEQAV
jgi:hypothetical protein